MPIQHKAKRYTSLLVPLFGQSNAENFSSCSRQLSYNCESIATLRKVDCVSNTHISTDMHITTVAPPVGCGGIDCNVVVCELLGNGTGSGLVTSVRAVTLLLR